MAKNNENAASRVMTNDEAEVVSDAFLSILRVLGSGDFGEGTLPNDLTKLGEKGEEALAVRLVMALRAKRNDAERQVMIAAKKGIDEVMHAARLARVDVYREIAGLSPAVKALMGKAGELPESTTVPVTDVLPFFPAGTSQENAIMTLHRMGMKLVPGASRDEVKKIRVNIGADFVKAQLEKTV